ncbi:hypothetical protein KBC86_05385 [Candidatus Gracilibacteria bacterium]|nr:hypothetical protein [Candidatus Gracilibacteria bacterium]
MRYLKVITFILGLMLMSPVHAKSTESFTGEVENKFKQTITRIMRINKEVKNNPKNLLLDEIYRRRDIYTRYGKSLYRYLEIRNNYKPTLDVSGRYKLYLQKYLLSCEIAALRIIVEAVSGKFLTEEIIISEIPHFREAYKDGVWGDPEMEFVGSYTGSQAKRTGYGIYGMPLSRFLDRKGYDNEYRNTLMSSGATGEDELEYALDSLEKGNHILFWADWCTTPEFDDGIVDKIDMYIVRHFGISSRNECERTASQRAFSWKTPTNEIVNAISGEHAFLLLGYVGKKENPSHIIVWDTDTGKHYYPILEWMRKWSLLDYRMLVVKK